MQQGGVWADSPYEKPVCVCPRNSIFANREADLALQITILVTVSFFAAFGVFVFIKTVKEAEDKKQRRRASENDSIVVRSVVVAAAAVVDVVVVVVVVVVAAAAAVVAVVTVVIYSNLAIFYIY